MIEESTKRAVMAGMILPMLATIIRWDLKNIPIGIITVSFAAFLSDRKLRYKLGFNW